MIKLKGCSQKGGGDRRRLSGLRAEALRAARSRGRCASWGRGAEGLPQPGKSSTALGRFQRPPGLGPGRDNRVAGRRLGDRVSAPASDRWSAPRPRRSSRRRQEGLGHTPASAAAPARQGLGSLGH